ncbi:MAG: hypothetical protein ABI467_28615 [Kofleriaceae bacterium]
MRTLSMMVLALSLAACGSNSSNSTDAAPGSGSGQPDGGGSGSSGSMTLTLSGTAQEISTSGKSPLPGVMITAYNASDDSALGMATSAADGTFAISVTTPTAIDGYLKATYGMYKVTYLYPPHPLSADYANVPVYMLSANTYAAANALLGNTGQPTTNGWIAMLVQDATGAAVSGAAISSTPQGKLGYNSPTLPSGSALSTAADGIGYDVDVATGTVTVSATKTGATFMSHAIKVRADAVTLTLVTP